jgi:transcriptional regulator with XRE-family HTH domain
VPWDLESSRRFGATLHTLRVERGLTQERLAHLSEVTKNHVQLLEAGIGSTRDRNTPSNPRMSTVFRLAEALGVEPADLLEASGAPGLPRAYRRSG